MPDVIPIPRLLSTRQAAVRLEVSIHTIGRLVRRREIQFRRIGGRVKFTESDIVDYIERQTVTPCERLQTTLDKSATSGFPSARIPMPGAGRGSMRPDARLAEFHSARAILSKPK